MTRTDRNMDHLPVDYLPVDYLPLVHCHTRPCLNHCQIIHLYALTKTRLVDDNPSDAPIRQYVSCTVSGVSPCNVHKRHDNIFYSEYIVHDSKNDLL